MKENVIQTSGRPNHRKRNWAGYIVFICGLLFALPHYWWALGISLAFPGEFTTGPGSTWPLWFVGTVAVAASVFGLSFVYPWGDKLPRWFKHVLAWMGFVLLSFWGLNYFVMKFLFATGRAVPSPAFAETDAHPMAVWGYFWYALFLVWGISFGLAAFTDLKNIRSSPRPTRS